MINEYEITYVTRPDLTDDVMGRITKKFETLIASNQGVMLVAEDWGKRKLSYPILKHNRGHYVYLNFVGPATIIAEVERNLRNEDNLLRFLTVVISKDVDVESRRVLAEERRRLRIERMAALKAEEEAEARYRAEIEESEEDAPVED